MDNAFPEGSVVYANINPALTLVIRHYVQRIYYCTIRKDPSPKEIVYFERALMNDPPSAN